MNDDLILLLDAEQDMILVDDQYTDMILVDDIPYADHHEEYTGEYTVIPILDDEQVLETNNKVMTDNVTVKPIPVVQTTNPYGGYTIVIG